MWPGPFEQLLFPYPIQTPYEIWASIGPVVSKEKMFKECGRRTDGQTTEAYLSYKLTDAPSALVS